MGRHHPVAAIDFGVVERGPMDAGFQIVGWRWRERFMEAGYDSLLQDKTRPSRIPPLASGVTERVVTLTQTAPPTEATPLDLRNDGEDRWHQREFRPTHLARARPHRVKQFKLSTDPRFVDKLRDVVGLYVDL